MQVKKEGKYLFVRMYSGENIFKNFEKLMEENNLKTAILISSVGMFENPELGYFNGKEYEITKFKGCFELLSCQGNAVKHEDGYIVHLHVVLGKEDFSTFGGHLINATVKVTNEMVLLIP